MSNGESSPGGAGTLRFDTAGQITDGRRILNGTTRNCAGGAEQHYIDVTWSGATATNVEVHRNGTIVATTANDGAHTDNLGRATGTFRYQVSHPGGSPISNEVTVTF